MKKILKNAILYILIIIFYFYLFIFSSLYGIINVFSSILFIILYLLIPLLILLLPIIIKYLLKKDIKIIKLNFILIVIHLLIILVLRYSITLYMKHFTIEKWSNKEWIELRYLMIDNLEEKYELIGMNIDNVKNILGKPDFSDENSICYDVRLYKEIVYNTYCLEYDKNNLIIDTNKTWIMEVEKMQVKKLESRPQNVSVSYIRDVLEYDRNNLEEQYKIYGKLKTLFGEPNYLSINNEDWFGYFLEYKGKYFEIYGRNDIPHIGGNDSEDSLKLAEEVSEYILSANPSYYEWISYYMDYNLKITYKVENGKALRVMEQLILTDKEFSELYNKVYNLK